MIKIRTAEELALGKPRAQYTDWSPDELKREIRKLKEKYKELDQAKIDELWPSYYNALMSVAQNSLDAMRKVESLVIGIKKSRFMAIKAIATPEIASLHEFIEEIEKEEALQDITIKLGGK